MAFATSSRIALVRLALVLVVTVPGLAHGATGSPSGRDSLASASVISVKAERRLSDDQSHRETSYFQLNRSQPWWRVAKEMCRSKGPLLAEDVKQCPAGERYACNPRAFNNGEPIGGTRASAGDAAAEFIEYQLCDCFCDSVASCGS